MKAGKSAGSFFAHAATTAIALLAVVGIAGPMGLREAGWTQFSLLTTETAQSGRGDADRRGPLSVPVMPGPKVHHAPASESAEAGWLRIEPLILVDEGGRVELTLGGAPDFSPEAPLHVVVHGLPADAEIDGGVVTASGAWAIDLVKTPVIRIAARGASPGPYRISVEATGDGSGLADIAATTLFVGAARYERARQTRANEGIALLRVSLASFDPDLLARYWPDLAINDPAGEAMRHAARAADGEAPDQQRALKPHSAPGRPVGVVADKPVRTASTDREIASQSEPTKAEGPSARVRQRSRPSYVRGPSRRERQSAPQPAPAAIDLSYQPLKFNPFSGY